MTLIAKTASTTEWKAVAAAAKLYLEEATFETNPEGLILRAMDPSHVALVNVNWPSSAFEKYECTKDDKFTVRVEDFVKLISRGDAKDTAEIEKLEGDSLVLRLANGHKREFKLHLIETVPGSAPLPKLDLDAKLVFQKTILDKILKDINVVADQVMIEATKDGNVTFSGKSDVGSGAVTLSKGGTEILECDVKQDSKASYNIEYLSGMLQAVGSVTEQVMVEFSSKKPVSVTFKIGEHGMSIQFFLAPRIQEE